MKDRDLRERLRSVRVPAEDDAERRAKGLVETAWSERQPRSHRRGRRIGLALAGAGLVALLGLSSAGAQIGDWIDETIGADGPAPSLTSLPTSGRLLVESRQGPWIVNEDGSQRRLGDYDQAVWSPHGLYVGATDDNRLVALEPDGDVRWTVTRDAAVRDPDWQGPDGFRIAYRDGHSLREVAGDGTGDHELKERVAGVGPAWRPGSDDTLAYGAFPSRPGAHDGGLVIEHAESGRFILGVPGPHLTDLTWAPNGRLLAAITGSAIMVQSADHPGDGPPNGAIGSDHGGRLSNAEFSPSSEKLAFLRHSGSGGLASSSLVVAPAAAAGRAERVLFSGPGTFTDLAWSPDGEWLVLAWKDADQWLFINLKHPERVTAVGNISSQFDPGGDGPAPFPRIAGWCCAD